MGRGATGVTGLAVPRGARVVAVSVARGGADDVEVLTLAVDGTGKRTALGEYPGKGRGGKGLQTGTVALAWCGVAADLHVPTAQGWTIVRPSLAPAGRRAGRGAPLTEAVTGPVVAESG